MFEPRTEDGASSQQRGFEECECEEGRGKQDGIAATYGACRLGRPVAISLTARSRPFPSSNL
eukprot:179209-Rhodomonas_salina.2